VSEPRSVENENHAELSDGTRVADDDAAILARHLRGDREAFAELVRRHGRYLFAVARRIVGPTEAEDIVQMAFVNALRAADRFEGRAAVRTWLHRITVNEALNHVRGRSARVFEEPLDDVAEPPSSDLEVDSQVIGQDLVSALLAALPPSTRQMVVMVDLLGYSMAEAAQALGVAEGTVKSRRARAFARLAGRVQP
jgi:RNA polymerase sigma-70 factor, ECF subfamily